MTACVQCSLVSLSLSLFDLLSCGDFCPLFEISPPPTEEGDISCLSFYQQISVTFFRFRNIWFTHYVIIYARWWVGRLFQMKEKLVRNTRNRCRLIIGNFLNIHSCIQFISANLHFQYLLTPTEGRKDTFHLCCWGLFAICFVSFGKEALTAKKESGINIAPHWSNPISRFYKNTDI